jgi:hypothetical protein
MDRREFLFLKRRPRSRKYELSCRWLYMKCLDTQVTGQLSLHSSDSDPQPGEGPALFDGRTTRQLFDDLDRQLRDVDTVRVTHMDWLTGDLRREFGNLMRAFRARGGRVVIERS